MALRLDVVEAAGARSSERRRAWADSSKRKGKPTRAERETVPQTYDATNAAC
jgi:hypothetical protein